MPRKQQELPGKEFEKVVIQEIEDAAEEYRAFRDERMGLAEKEKQAKAKLLTTMQTHGQTTYRYLDEDETERRVFVEPKTNVKVSKVRPSDPSADTDVDVT